MTTIQLDFRRILNEAPFDGKITFSPESNGLDNCTFYLNKAEEVDFILDGPASPVEVELAPSRFVGSYEVRVTGDPGYPVYFSGRISVPDSGTYCLSALIGIAEIEQRPNYRVVTSVNGESGDVIVTGGGGRFEFDFSQGALSNNGVLVVVHSLGDEPSAVTVLDQTGEQFDPDEMRILDPNRVQITLASVTPLVGTWKILVAL